MYHYIYAVHAFNFDSNALEESEPDLIKYTKDKSDMF